MIRPKLTVIFDRSAFHGERFDALRKSHLRQLTKNGVVVVHHTPAFLEETISMYEKPSNRDELRAQLPFILDICNGRWFLQPEEIWHLELVQNRGPEANVFLEGWRRRDTEARMRKGALDPAGWTELLQSLPLKDPERQKQKRQRELLVEMRGAIAVARKAPDFPKHEKPPAATDFIRRELDDWGKMFIAKHIRYHDTSRIFQMWSRNKLRYPFFTSFLEGLLYADWQALVEHGYFGRS